MIHHLTVLLSVIPTAAAIISLLRHAGQECGKSLLSWRTLDLACRISRQKNWMSTSLTLISPVEQTHQFL